MKATYNPGKMTYPELLQAKTELKKELDTLLTAQKFTVTQMAHTALQRAVAEVRRVEDQVVDQLVLMEEI